MKRNKTIFEKIVDGKIPCSKVLENEKFLAFNDIAPKAPVHILIIPKKWIKDFNDVDSKLMGDISEFILEVVEHLKIKESGYRIITNIGIDGGQEVPHLHFHLLAKKKLDLEFFN